MSRKISITISPQDWKDALNHCANSFELCSACVFAAALRRVDPGSIWRVGISKARRWTAESHNLGRGSILETISLSREQRDIVFNFRPNSPAASREWFEEHYPNGVSFELEAFEIPQESK